MSFEKIEIRIHKLLTKYPNARNKLGKIYQRGMYLISPKVKSEGDITRVSPEDNYEYFFGYYDKSPWDKTDRYMLCLRAKDTHSSAAPKQKAEIILIDTQKNNEYEVIAITNAWNVQQGCMLQWLGPDYSKRIIYNDYRDGEYCSVILSMEDRTEKIVKMPIYSVASDGKIAFTLDFSRLHRLRPGYGYSCKEDSTKDQLCPDTTCIWKVDLETSKTESLLKYTDFYSFETRPEMIDAEHKVNHIMINPSGNRFMVLHRWMNKSMKYSRLITCNQDGSEMYNLSDDDFVSHCYWKNDYEILSYLNKKEKGKGYYLMTDRTKKYQYLWKDLVLDGHPSYSHNDGVVVTDTYPNRQRLQTIYIIKDDKISKVARVLSPFKYGGDVRCDLHPRWNRAGDKICIDSTFEDKRGLYIVNIDYKEIG